MKRKLRLLNVFPNIRIITNEPLFLARFNPFITSITFCKNMKNHQYTQLTFITVSLGVLNSDICMSSANLSAFSSLQMNFN